MRAAPGRAVAPRVIARISLRVDIASLVMAQMVADQGEFRVNRIWGQRLCSGRARREQAGRSAMGEPMARLVS